ncbi:hypothetical protein DSM110093_03938 (plasmid) [Sulfitobacter sp. DSM 110093]|uniref:GNAT family N-acetyltransferase n=1 Tax=Sulfitobacter sp. DSM 110093 TaxID=2883127 RepID=UPI001FAC51D5|nr:GNAT family N-acetyltransferase [Sulfitobacter sp. DSM 110093]UOA34103.1 hypothetical protein DSM110093_03938 [Sulfitobacter sp. DSM 110093]
MMIREMEYTDLDAVVVIHKKAFSGFFLSRMGSKFLRAYYQAVLDFEASVALVAHETDSILGFAVGFRDPQGFYAMFKRQRSQMLPAIMLAVLRDPGLILKIFHNMRRVEAQAHQPVDAVELSSIAVSTPGSGGGGALLEAFAYKARSEGAHRLILTTDAEENDLVRRFYETRGFILDGYEYRGKRRMCRYARFLG